MLAEATDAVAVVAQPANQWGAQVAMWGALGAIAIALGPVLARALDRWVLRADAAGYAAKAHTCDGCEQIARTIPTLTIEAFVLRFGERAAQLARHFDENHIAIMGANITGSDGMLAMMTELLATARRNGEIAAKLADALHDLRRARRDVEER